MLISRHYNTCHLPGGWATFYSDLVLNNLVDLKCLMLSKRSQFFYHELYLQDGIEFHFSKKNDFKYFLTGNLCEKWNKILIELFLHICNTYFRKVSVRIDTLVFILWYIVHFYNDLKNIKIHVIELEKSTFFVYSCCEWPNCNKYCSIIDQLKCFEPRIFNIPPTSFRF